MDEAMRKKAGAKLQGLTRDLIHSLIKDYGCDLIFRFNYNGINAGIANRKVGKHMEALHPPPPAPLSAAAIQFAYITGLCIRSEILPMNWAQLDFAAGTIRLGGVYDKEPSERELGTLWAQASSRSIA
jgi:integrase